MTKDLHLAIGKQLVGVVFRKLGCDLDRNSPSSRVNLANPIDQLARRHALKQVSSRTFCEGPANLVVAVESSQDDATCVGKFGTDGDHCVYAAHVRKPEIHESDVRLVLSKQLNRLACVGSLC